MLQHPVGQSSKSPFRANPLRPFEQLKAWSSQQARPRALVTLHATTSRRDWRPHLGDALPWLLSRVPLTSSTRCAPSLGSYKSLCLPSFSYNLIPVSSLAKSSSCTLLYLTRLHVHFSSQQVKALHQRPYGKLQPLEILKWKWEHIATDFVTALPKTVKGNTAIWVIIDRLTKCAHFIPIPITYVSNKLAQIYIREIVRLHGVPVTITSDRNPKFTSRFWISLQRELGARVNFSTAFHTQTDGQSERTIQTPEDILRAVVLDREGSWESALPLIEFAYNNSFQVTINMALCMEGSVDPRSTGTKLASEGYSDPMLFKKWWELCDKFVRG